MAASVAGDTQNCDPTNERTSLSLPERILRPLLLLLLPLLLGNGAIMGHIRSSETIPRPHGAPAGYMSESQCHARPRRSIAADTLTDEHRRFVCLCHATGHALRGRRVTAINARRNGTEDTVNIAAKRWPCTMLSCSSVHVTHLGREFLPLAMLQEYCSH